MYVLSILNTFKKNIFCYSYVCVKVQCAKMHIVHSVEDSIIQPFDNYKKIKVIRLVRLVFKQRLYSVA